MQFVRKVGEVDLFVKVPQESQVVFHVFEAGPVDGSQLHKVVFGLAVVDDFVVEPAQFAEHPRGVFLVRWELVEDPDSLVAVVLAHAFERPGKSGIQLEECLVAVLDFLAGKDVEPGGFWARICNRARVVSFQASAAVAVERLRHKPRGDGRALAVVGKRRFSEFEPLGGTSYGSVWRHRRPDPRGQKVRSERVVGIGSGWVVLGLRLAWRLGGRSTVGRNRGGGCGLRLEQLAHSDLHAELGGFFERGKVERVEADRVGVVESGVFHVAQAGIEVGESVVDHRRIRDHRASVLVGVAPVRRRKVGGGRWRLVGPGTETGKRLVTVFGRRFFVANGEHSQQHEDALLVFFQLQTQLGKQIGTPNVAADTLGPVIHGHEPALSKERLAVEMKRVGVALVHGQKPFCGKFGIAEVVVVERVDYDQPEVLSEVLVVGLLGHFGRIGGEKWRLEQVM